MRPVQLTVQDAQLAAKWDSFLNAYAKEQIQEAALDFPETRSVTVAFNDIQLRDPDLANYLLHKPSQCLRLGVQVLHQVDVTVDPKPKMHLRVLGLPNTATVGVRDLRVEHIGRLVAIEGMVKKMTEARAALLEAVFECRVCTTQTRSLQDDEFLVEPVICETCEAQRPWRFVEEDSRYLDHQKLELQEAPENLRGGQQPERLVVHVNDDLVHQVAPGDRVRINGILTTRVRREGGKKRIEFDKLLNAVTIEVLEHSFEDIHLTPEDEAAAVALSQDPACYEKLVKSVAPVIHGHDDVKEALLLALFGAPGRQVDGGWWRGDPHVLLIGDPGIAKTKMLRRLVELSPRGVFASAKTASGVGLTGTTVQDDFGGKGVWTIEAGVLPSAHKGLLGLDELPNLPQEDHKSLYEALEEQTITFSKAARGIYRCHCSVVATGNPREGRFSPYEAPYEQIDVAPQLLSRFDLVFCLRDRPDKDVDRAIAQQIGRIMNGTAPTAREQGGIDVDELRRYVAFARRIAPTLSQGARDYVSDLHATLRSSADPEGLPMTHRQANVLYRLSMALARIHLRSEATVEDAKQAWRLVQASLRSLGAVKDGVLDFGVMETLQSTSQHARNGTVLATIRQLCKESPKGHTVDSDVFESLDQSGWTEPEIRKSIEQLLRNTLVRPKGCQTLAPLNG
jgi:replicative DNA helicase Mcm